MSRILGSLGRVKTDYFTGKTLKGDVRVPKNSWIILVEERWVVLTGSKHPSFVGFVVLTQQGKIVYSHHKQLRKAVDWS